MIASIEDDSRTMWLLLATTLACVLGSGCESEGCLDGDEGCTVPTPCSRLVFACDGRDGFATIEIMDEALVPRGSTESLAATGDFLLRNDRVTAVVEALDHPHYVAPSGGSLLDLGTADGEDDALNHVFHATGLLPGDAVRYTEARILEDGDARALQLEGHLDGHPEQRVATRYEIRPCEPGIRVRTEVVNGESEPAVWSVTDGWYWGGRSNLAFAPFRGGGFEWPKVSLSSIDAAFRQVPYLATVPHTPDGAAYTCIPCNVSALDGFHSDDFSAMGLSPRIVPPRDYEVFERFIAVAGGGSAAPAVDHALEARRQLFGEPWVELSGRVSVNGGSALSNETRATARISEGRAADPPSARTPRTQVTPGPDGRFVVRVPADRTYTVEVDAFGRIASTGEVAVGSASHAMDEIAIASAGVLDLVVTVDGEPDHALVLLYPADDATHDAVVGERLGAFGRCAPLLGPPHGGSPACNRALVHDRTSVELLPGRYHVYATVGPFATIARRDVTVSAGERAEAMLDLARLPIQPAGTLSADLHVHGAVSFDSSIPDLDRVQAFLAAGIDVIASTDHDLVHDYADAMAMLGADERMQLIAGVETTGHILYDYVPGSDFPQVVGHWNFWPVPFDPVGPWRGAPWDELAEPGVLLTRVEDHGWPSTTGVAQLNHPWSPDDFGRDLGFPRAIGVQADEPLPAVFDGSGPSLFHRVPAGARFRNSDYHVQEVMNGSANTHHPAFRAFWFYLLSQGVVRGGTANSDSHGLTDNVLGAPRNLVWTETTVARFEAARFNEAVRDGRMIGTNGPIIEAEITDSGVTRRPSLSAFSPTGSAVLRVRVTAAPWVPVEELRIVVDGEVVTTIADELVEPADPFGSEGLLRYEGEFLLADLLPPESSGDAWIVVEAGAALTAAADLSCDGIPDTGDNDGNGIIDRHDVDVDATADTASPRVTAEIPECLDDVGPLRQPPVPVDREARGYHFAAVVPRGRPQAFTNPFLLDLDGGGFTGSRR